MKDRAKRTAKKRSRSKARKGTLKTPHEENNRRYMLLELSCAGKKCDPCTYPDCQRFVREVRKRPPISTKMFELGSLETEGHFEPGRRYIVVELACKEKRCNPCTYPNCQRFTREAKRKARYTTPLFELSRVDWKKLRKSILDGSLDGVEEVATLAA